MISSGVVRGNTPLPTDRAVHPALRATLGIAEFYKQLVTSPLNPLLARSRPVRRTGFERVARGARRHADDDLDTGAAPPRHWP